MLEALKAKPNSILIVAHTDSNNLVKALNSTSLVSDQRLRINIGALKQIISEDNVRVEWISAQEMLADSLTKKGADMSRLMAALQYGDLNQEKKMDQMVHTL